jgi:hypothetical protein
MVGESFKVNQSSCDFSNLNKNVKSSLQLGVNLVNMQNMLTKKSYRSFKSFNLLGLKCDDNVRLL